MSIIKNITELQKYVRLAGTLDFNLLEPYRDLSIQQDMLEYCGGTLLSKLAAYNSDPDEETNPRFAELLPYVAMPLAYFTLKHAGPFIDLQITNAGFAVVSNSNLAPASRDRVQNLTNAINNLAYSSLDRLLDFLETNVSRYPDWEKSLAFTERFNCYVRSGSDIKNIVRIDQPCLTAYRYRTAFLRAQQFKIDPIISIEMGADIRKKLLNGSLPANYLLIINDLKAATYYFAAAEEENNSQYEITGEKYLASVRQIIDATPDNYPIYKASSVYVTPANYNNNPTTETSPIIMLGSF